LLSVSDKTGIVEFAKGLCDLGITILSTGGTAQTLREAGVRVTDVSEHTGSPEILDGRVKTLHPRIHGGILARRDDPTHRDEVAAQGIAYIDLVCVNLYPFAAVTARGCSREEAIENIDIGGPSMIRSAAKNHSDVTVIVDPSDYERVLAALRASRAVPEDLRRELAIKAFRATAAYDGMIADHFGREPDSPFSASLHQQWYKLYDLRYGENPHQRSAFYRRKDGAASLATARMHHGKELSYNNIVDTDAAVQLAMEFSQPVCVAIKHTNPCGVATGADPAEAFLRARACDPVSIFGGIIAFNRIVDEATAEAIGDVFLEVVVAPAYSARALEVCREAPKLRNTRLLELDPCAYDVEDELDQRRALGGLLVQTRDPVIESEREWKSVARRAPTEEETRALRFAWRVCKHVKSNAIVLAREDRVVGVGAGQMSRVDAAHIAVARARDHGHEIAGTAVASDAFFPFRDGLDVCAEAGATAVIQPGGSVRDGEIIAAANQHGMAMVLTGRRHFRH
jgi:phosphoribosylaminoimidazolecarboxamide formyltransferase/IMP cyclohydrolase